MHKIEIDSSTSSLRFRYYMLQLVLTIFSAMSNRKTTEIPLPKTYVTFLKNRVFPADPDDEIDISKFILEYYGVNLPKDPYVHRVLPDLINIVRLRDL